MSAPQPPLSIDLSPLSDALARQEMIQQSTTRAVQELAGLIAGLRDRAEIYEIVALSNMEYKIQRGGRRYVSVFSPTAVSSVVAQILGLGSYTFNLAAGWTTINLPDGSALTYSSGATVMVRYADYQTGSEI